ncbi:recombinase family protein [Chloroflexota bacterium]
MRAGLYARVSSEEQAEGYSIDAQLDAMRRFCRDRGWTIAGEYTEPGVSGTTGNRPAFQAVLREAEQGKLDVLLTHQLDRFYRNLLEQLQTLGQLGQWGVGYLSVTEQIDYSTPQGKLFLSMLGAFNEYYSANLSRETKKSKLQRAKQGKSNASLSPYGYQREEPGKHVLDPEAGQAVILAFESYVTGKYSDNDVAGILNRAGYPPSGRAESGRWTREAVRYLLNNPYYIGKVRHGDELYPGRHEPLIDEALFNKVQALRQKRGKGRGGGRRPDRVYLLAGLAHCHLCRLPLIGQTSKDWKGTERQYLRDVADRRGFDCPTGGRSVQTEVLDKAIGELVARLILPPDWRAQIVDLVECEDRRASVARERTRLKEKLRRLQKAYFDVEIDEDTYRRERDEAQVERDALVIPEEPDVVAAGQFLETFADIWVEAIPKERKDLLGLLLEEVLVDVAEDRIVCVKPKASFVALFQQVPGLEERDGCFHLASNAAS